MKRRVNKSKVGLQRKQQSNKSKIKPIDPTPLIQNFCKFYEHDDLVTCNPETAVAFLARSLFCGGKDEPEKLEAMCGSDQRPFVLDAMLVWRRKQRTGPSSPALGHYGLVFAMKHQAPPKRRSSDSPVIK
jgi:hypothetical protein